MDEGEKGEENTEEADIKFRCADEVTRERG